MARIQLTENLYRASGVMPGHKVLVAAKGEYVDESILGERRPTPSPSAADDSPQAPAGYADMKVPELRALLDERKIDHSDLRKKQDLVDALEDHDAGIV